MAAVREKTKQKRDKTKRKKMIRGKAWDPEATSIY